MPESPPDQPSAEKPATTPAQLPSSPGQLHSALKDLLHQGDLYRRAQPKAAARGDWWDPLSGRVPQSQLPPEFVMDPARAREAAVLVLFCTQEHRPHTPAPYVLLTERAAGLAKHPGQISFPGGASEDFDPDPSATALREAQEEIGLDPVRVEIAGTLPPAPVPVSGYMVTPVLAVTSDPGVLTPQSGEVARVLRAPVAHLRDPQRRRTSMMQRGGMTFRGPSFLHDDVLVWGFTGILLDRIIARLGWEQPWDTSQEVSPF
ncbi:NUDIX hydrolase [Nesterenkonia flava]|uniref:CoA pyrophosphatase n=1 Tax=Nesterenkonia flava TaxID=469799 RepID=A0ABU1FUG3_9MICC|nr:CoA pyrophosphatase [Nesterenkonia flava]MDR5712309.1 CoA pyrophosphatase [Nesterenkonia flava]